MLREAFVHIPGIGRRTGSALWQSGIVEWSDLRTTRLASRVAVEAALRKSEEALTAGDIAFFFDHLPKEDRWRTFIDFANNCAALDIEITGLSVYDKITVVGVDQGRLGGRSGCSGRRPQNIDRRGPYRSCRVWGGPSALRRAG